MKSGNGVWVISGSAWLLLGLVGCGAPMPSSARSAGRAAPAKLSNGLCDNTPIEVPQSPRSHVPACLESGYTPPTYTTNPPVSGPHFADVWATYQVFTTPVPRGYYVHNLEHGAAVLVYRPDAPPEIVAALGQIFDALPTMGNPSAGSDPTPGDYDCGIDPNGPMLKHKRALVTPDPLLPKDITWALTMSGPEVDPDSCAMNGTNCGVGYQIRANCVASVQGVVDFIVAHRGTATENECADGITPECPAE